MVIFSVVVARDAALHLPHAILCLPMYSSRTPPLGIVDAAAPLCADVVASML
jgi:hypothetical protein